MTSALIGPSTTSQISRITLSSDFPDLATRLGLVVTPSITPMAAASLISPKSAESMKIFMRMCLARLCVGCKTASKPGQAAPFAHRCRSTEPCRHAQLFRSIERRRLRPVQPPMSINSSFPWQWQAALAAGVSMWLLCAPVEAENRDARQDRLEGLGKDELARIAPELARGPVVLVEFADQDKGQLPAINIAVP